MKLLEALRWEAQDWWWHVRLRKEGQIAEARRSEREQILGWIRDARAMHHGFLRLDGEGYGEGSLAHRYKHREYYGESGTSTGISPRVALPLFLASGRPFVVADPYRPRANAAAVRGPFCDDGQGAEPTDAEGAWGCLARAPLGVWLAVQEWSGAAVFWGELEPERESWIQKAQPTITRMKKT